MILLSTNTICVTSIDRSCALWFHPIIPHLIQAIFKHFSTIGTTICCQISAIVSPSYLRLMVSSAISHYSSNCCFNIYQAPLALQVSRFWPRHDTFTCGTCLLSLNGCWFKLNKAKITLLSISWYNKLAARVSSINFICSLLAPTFYLLSVSAHLCSHIPLDLIDRL